ncbi:MAG: arginine deiminase-related protein [Sediminibacterium sp.]
MQHTEHLLMIRPVKFDFNAETAVNNRFQTRSGDQAVQEKAAREFDGFIAVLRTHGIDVTVVPDTPEPPTPDAVFPNNWISFHSNGTVCLYPMFAVNRRMERKSHVIEALEQKFEVRETVDLTGHEALHVFLEGTGSMVLDRENKIAYACLSPRPDQLVLTEWCSIFGYQPVSFTAVDAGGLPIYHTNVMMCVADHYAVICLASIAAEKERKKVIDALSRTSKQLIDISFDQVNHFAGNMLQVHNKEGKIFLVMSTQAWQSLTGEQRKQLKQFNSIIHAAIPTIETNGGGSVRCMMAEVFLPLKEQ